MSDDRAANVQTLRAFCARHPTWVLFDETGPALHEIASGKRLPLPLRELVSVAERQNLQTGQPYLLLELGDGRELALAEMGVAFPPIAPQVPQAPPLPPVVCLKDFAAVLAQLQHLAFEHPEEKLDRTGLDLMVLGLGILQGARHLGFDIGEEERALDAVLTALEKRR